jgi:hypothetical protein
MAYSLGDLSLMYDGTIPEDLRRSAVQTYALIYFKPERRVPLPKVRRKPASAEDIAGTMLERTAATGCCTRDDLVNAGFTPREIDRLGTAAIARASSFNMECD